MGSGNVCITSRCHFKMIKIVCFTKSCPTFCWHHGQDLPLLFWSPGVCSKSCSLSLWSHLTVSSSVIPFSSCLHSFPESGSFPMSWLFVSGGQNIGASASASVLPINTQGWFPLGLADLISLLPKGLTRVFCSTTIWKHQFSDTQPSLCIYDHNFQSKCKN